jgi:hypothetical protein
MTKSSKRKLTLGMLPFKRGLGADRIEELPRGMTVRRLFKHKRFQRLKDRYVCVSCDRGLWHSMYEIEKGVAR